MKIFLSAGHSNQAGKDKGAVIGSLTEGDLTVRVRSMIAAAISQLGGTFIIDDNSLVTAETVKAWRNKIGPNDVALDIHFNVSSNTSIEGVEALVPANPTTFELKIADKLTDIINTLTGTPERGRVSNYDGVKLENEGAHSHLAWMSLPGSTVLLECQFISDQGALNKFLSKLPDIAKQIAEYLVQLQKTQP
jgi:N-acetylmuramoyl-L-alanine amidase